MICSVFERISIHVDLAGAMLHEDFEMLEKQKIMIECYVKAYCIFRFNINIIETLRVHSRRLVSPYSDSLSKRGAV